MQVENSTVPASPVVIPETPVPPTPILPTQSSDNVTVPPTGPDSSEQPTFHMMQPPPTSTTLTPTVPVESALSTSTPSVNNPQTTAVPTAPDQTTNTNTSAPIPKQNKRGSRASHSKNIHRSPAKPATLMARPSTGKTSTILPQPQKAVLLSNQMTPLVPKPSSNNAQVAKPTVNNSTAGFTTYLVVDGNQGQLVQVANDGQKPITFRNQAGQILQATPITVVSTANQPVVSTFATNGEATLMSNGTQINAFPQQQNTLTSLATQQTQQNPSQTVTTVRTSSSIDMQRTMLTSDTTTLTTQHVTGMAQIPATSSLLNGCNLITHQPSLLQPNPMMMSTSLLNGSGLHSHDRDGSPGHHDNDSSLDEPNGLDASTNQDHNGSLSLSQLARKANHRQRRSSSSSLSKKKRGRPRLYERDPFTNKPIKSRPMPEGTELTLPNVTPATNTTLLMPGQTTTTTYNTLHPHSNGCASLIFPNQSMNHTTTTIPTANPSLLQQQTYSYPSLLNGNAPSTNMLSAPTLNIFSNTNNHSTMSNGYSYTSTSTSLLPPAPLPIPPSPGISRPLVTPLTQSVENQATIPLKNLQISSGSSPMTSSPRMNTSATTLSSTTSNANNPTTVPNVVQLNPSPIKSLNPNPSNNDVVVHYIGGFIIRESSQPFPLEDRRDDDHNNTIKDLNLSNGKEKENTSFNEDHSDLGSDQLRCTSCRKVDFSERFYNQEKRICSRTCATKPSRLSKTNSTKKPLHEKVPPMQETSSSRPIDQNYAFQSSTPSPIEEAMPLAPDHGLPADPSKWTVHQVGEFIARLTNETIREAFYESEMDGQALLLMTQEHLRDTMKIKLGPSLIIASEITKLRERARTFSC